MTAGRDTRTFRKLAANIRAQRRPCMICGQAIDYTLDANDRYAFTVEHIKPLSLYPHLAEDPANLGASHRACGSAKGTGDMKPGLGNPSQAW